MTSSPIKHLRLTLLAASLALLTACGGGTDTGTTTSSATPDPAPAPAPVTPSACPSVIIPLTQPEIDEALVHARRRKARA